MCSFPFETDHGYWHFLVVQHFGIVEYHVSNVEIHQQVQSLSEAGNVSFPLPTVLLNNDVDSVSHESQRRGP